MRAITRVFPVTFPIVALAIGVFGPSGPGAAAEEAPRTSTIDDLRLGTHWHGPEISIDDLRGKVVLFELWGS